MSEQKKNIITTLNTSDKIKDKVDNIPNLTDKKQIKKSKKNKKKRCNHKECNKKLSFMDIQMVCKCNKYFCNKHRPLSSHICTANHIKINQDYLIKNNPVVIPIKLNIV